MNVFDAESGELIPEEQVADAVTSGRAAIDPNSSFILRDSSGGRIELSGQDAANSLAHHISQGYRLETAEEADTTQRILDARSSPIQGGAEALVQGASLGLYGAAAGQISDEYAQGMLDRRDALGGAATALELTGAVLPSFISGGAFTPAGALARATEVGGRALEQTLLKRGVGAGIAKVAGMAAEGGLDGAVSGALQQLSEDSLGGHEITAERLAASGGVGALLGLGGGATLGALSVGVRKGARGIADKIAAREAKAAGSVDDLLEATEHAGAKEAGGFSYLKEKYIDAASAASGSDPKFLREMADNPQLGQDWLKQDDIRAGYHNNIRTSLQDVVDFEPAQRSIAAGEIKASTVRKNVKQGPEAAAEAQRKAQYIFNDVQETLSKLSPDLSKKEFTAFRRDLNDVELQIGKGVGKGANDEVYNVLDNYKRAMDSIVDKGPRGGGTQLEMRNHQAIFEMAQANGDRLRRLLEDESAFGEMGRIQKEHNASIREVIETGKVMQDALLKRTGESANEVDWHIKKQRVDDGKTSTFLDNLNDPTRSQASDGVQKALEARQRYNEMLLRNDLVPDSRMGEYERAKLGAEKAIETLKNGRRDLGKFGQLNAMEKAEREAAGLMSSGTLATVGGFIAGGIGSGLGATAGALFGATKRPAGIYRQVAQLEAIRRRALGVSAAVREKTQSAVRELAIPRARRVGKAGVRASILYFGSDRDSQRKNAKRVEARLNDLRRDPQKVVDAIGYQTQTISQVAPKTTLALSAQTSRATAFLDSKLPPPSGNPNQLQPALNKTFWTDEQVDRFGRYVATLDNPLTALDDLKAGRLAPESVEVLQAVYPHIYDEMRQAAMEEVAAHGEELPYDSVIQLSLLLGFQGHPTLEPSFIKTIQDAWANPPKSEAKGPSPSNTRPMTIQTSEVDRLMGGLSAR